MKINDMLKLIPQFQEEQYVNPLNKKIKPLIMKIITVSKPLRNWIMAICCLMAWFNILAQDPSEIAPPTPTAASLGEYGAIPVGLYTGVPSISIPIYEIQGRGISLPISLSYHASGIRVEDVPSWVGLGWALHAGGVITQNIMDKNDMGTERVDIPEGTTTSAIAQRESILLNLCSPSPKDLMPDNFSYNFCGYSGEFVYDKDGNCIIPDNPNFIITKYPEPGCFFKIVDPNGISYYFSEYESTNTGFTRNVTTLSYCLTKIEAPGGVDEITFEYDSEHYFNYHRRGGKKYYRNTSTSTVFDTYGGHTVGMTESDISGQRLTKIVHGKTEILFKERSTPREDLLQSSSYALKEIQIKYNSQPVKSFYFNTASYFRASKIFEDDVHPHVHPNISNFGDYEFLDKRLKLSDVREKDDEGNEVKKWEFRYYGDDNASLNLPNRWSPARDHWGFYNGATTNTDLNPGHSGTATDNLFSWLSPYSFTCRYPGTNYSDNPYNIPDGANRDPSATYCKSNTLKSITWPTKGRTDFEYGIHSHTRIAGSTSGSGTAGGLRIEEVRNYSSGNILTIGKKYVYHDGILMENTNNYFRKVLYNPLSGIPVIDLPINSSCYGEEHNDYYLEVASNSHYSMSPKGSSVVYRQVDELSINENGNDSIGKIEHFYYSPYNFV